MSKILKIIISCFVLVFFLLTGTTAYATVGGPTYISDFKYSPTDESVYYKLYDNNGRGCPPMLMKISLIDSRVDSVYSCDQGEDYLSSYPNNYELGVAKLIAEYDKITADFKSLNPINLRKNNIDINLKFIRKENLPGELDMIKNSIFNAVISKDNRKVLETEISGCSTEQPFTFAGYSIPGFDKKIVILNSSKGNCFEGGYINESLIVVGGLESINKDPINFYKSNTALIPNEGTLTVYPSDNNINIQENQNIIENLDDIVENKSPWYSNFLGKNIYIVFFIIIAFSIFLGFMIGKMSNKQNK